MAKIIWEGNKNWDVVWNGQQAWDKEIEQMSVPENSMELKRPDEPVKASAPYMILPMLLCFFAVFLKTRSAHEFLFDPVFMIPSCIIGLLTAMPLHELLHALTYPKEATVYIGISIKGLKAYAASSFGLRRGRFILMSLAPAVLGLAAMAVFLLCPISLKWLDTLAVFPMFMGLLSPAPDYMDILLVLKQTPKHAVIQPAVNGYLWYSEEA